MDLRSISEAYVSILSIVEDVAEAQTSGATRQLGLTRRLTERLR